MFTDPAEQITHMGSERESRDTLMLCTAATGTLMKTDRQTGRHTGDTGAVSVLMCIKMLLTKKL